MRVSTHICIYVYANHPFIQLQGMRTYLRLVLGLVLAEGHEGAALRREDAGDGVEWADDVVVLLGLRFATRLGHTVK